MATYIMMMKFTTAGIQAITDAAEGRKAGKKAAAALGIKWKQQYLVMGAYDVLTIVEAPSDEVMATFALIGGMSGSFTIDTMRVFNEAEADKLLKQLKEMEAASGG